MPKGEKQKNSDQEENYSNIYRYFIIFNEQ